MMKLTPAEEDALIELGNIGMSKAAKQLSALLNSPIKISIPQISLIQIEDIEHHKEFNNQQILSSVSQTISSDLQGCAALLFQREQTNLLTMAVLGEIPHLTPEEARVCEQEALLEIGNIIITSCLSVMVNMLAKTVKVSLPVYDESNMLVLLKNLCKPIYPLTTKVIALSTKLDTFNNKLSGHLFIILTQESIDELMASIRKLVHE